MPKLLVSMIGLGDYEFTNYKMPEDEDGLRDSSCYHQNLLKKALNPDIVWLVGTKEARNKHSHKIDHDKFIQISKCSKSEEFWDIFTKISTEFDEMKTHDEMVEICLDLTHGFRTQPIFLLSAVRCYCRLYDDMFLIGNIYYSMFEKGEKIKKSIFKENPGIKGQALSKILAEKKKNHHILQYLHIKNHLVKFGDLIGLNYTPGAADCISRLCELSLKASKSLDGEMVPIAKAFSKLNEELNIYFPNEDRPLWKWHAAIARWCLKRNFLQQALTHANELLTTRYCEETGLDPLNRDDRSTLLPKVLEDKKAKPRKGLCEAWTEAVKQDLSLSNERNCVNHAFCRNSTIKIDQFSKSTRRKVEELLNFHMSLENLPELNT